MTKRHFKPVLLARKQVWIVFLLYTVCFFLGRYNCFFGSRTVILFTITVENVLILYKIFSISRNKSMMWICSCPTVTFCQLTPQYTRNWPQQRFHIFHFLTNTIVKTHVYFVFSSFLIVSAVETRHPKLRDWPIKRQCLPLEVTWLAFVCLQSLEETVSSQ